MSLPRLIPSLLIKDESLWKGVEFDNYKYVGDISNTISIFSEKEVDELLIVDIHASLKGEGPNFPLLERVLAQAFVPVTYGGGVRTAADARRLVEIGVDRVSINSSFLGNHQLASEIASEIGQSSTSVSLDFYGSQGFWKVRGQIATQHGLGLESVAESLLRKVDESGVGQLVIQDVERDGTQSGFREELIDFVLLHSNTPLVYGGGLRSMNDAYLAWSKGASGVIAGAKFVFVGAAKAVMLNYPDRENFKWI